VTTAFAIGRSVARARVRRRPPRSDVSYSSGFSKNVEWLLGPWFVLFGGFFFLEIAFLHPAVQLPGQSPAPPSPIPFVVFPILGLVFCYFAFFRRVSRLEISDGTLYWFLPFRRLKGQAAIADIVSLWTEADFSQWRLTRTAIHLRNGRTVKIRDRREIVVFVSALVADSPTIDLENWKPRVPRDGTQTFGSPYVNNDNGRGVIDRR
jgi:hypothetical protein